TGGTADRNRSHWSTSKTPSYTKSVSWQHHRIFCLIISKHSDSPCLCIYGVCYGSQIYKAHSAWQIFAASLLRLVLVDDFYILTP
ncbi:hypothetical protein, partial [Shigella sonnei]|uniref:hypothetical protein n=1 Tax=Shigella sonnei TaxID=624 RepID=UPI001493B7D5